MRAPASLKMRRSTDGIVTMVGPMSKRKPSPRQLGRFAAEPIVAFEKDDFVSARRQDAGCGKPAESAADDADWFHDVCFLRSDLRRSVADQIDRSRRSALDHVHALPECKKKKAAHRPRRSRRNAGVSFRDGPRRHAGKSSRANPRRRACCRSRSPSLRRTACADRRSER